MPLVGLARLCKSCGEYQHDKVYGKNAAYF